MYSSLVLKLLVWVYKKSNASKFSDKGTIKTLPKVPYKQSHFRSWTMTKKANQLTGAVSEFIVLGEH